MSANQWQVSHFRDNDEDRELPNSSDSNLGEDDGEVARLGILRDNMVKKVERLLDELEDDQRFANLSDIGVRSRQERLRKHFDSFENADVLYRQHNFVCTDAVFVRLEDRLLASMEKSQSRLDGQRNEQGSSSTMLDFDSRTPQIIKVETAQPPRLRKFDGNPADWPAFRDLFVAEVHNKALDPVTKLLHLQECCVDRAAKTLGPWQLIGENYNLAWQTLGKAYEDDYHVIHSILGRMYAVEGHDRESHDSLRSVVDSISSGTRQLNTMATKDQIQDQIWIHHSKQRLPKYTLDAWEQHRSREGVNKLPTLDEFLNFLDIKAKGRREFEDTQSSGAAKQSSYKPGSYKQRNIEHSSGNGQREQSSNQEGRYRPYNKQYRPNQHNPFRSNYGQYDSQKNNQGNALVETGHCFVPGCTGSHEMDKCNVFQKMDLKERWTTVNQLKVCRCCLRRGHPAIACRQDGCTLCPDAQPKHHSRLCSKARHNTKPSAAGQAPLASHP